MRSAQAVAYLTAKGHDVVNLDGGMLDWAGAGRPPVLMKIFAGAWLKTFVAIERTTARSSTTPARCGRHSETRVPRWPC